MQHPDKEIFIKTEQSQSNDYYSIQPCRSYNARQNRQLSMAFIGFAIIWRARSFSVRAKGVFMTHIEVNIHIITCYILDKFANLVVSFAGVFRMSRNACLRELHLWLAQIGKGMWFECEQLFLSGERWVTSQKTAAKETTDQVEQILLCLTPNCNSQLMTFLKKSVHCKGSLTE